MDGAAADTEPTKSPAAPLNHSLTPSAQRGWHDVRKHVVGAAEGVSEWFSGAAENIYDRDRLTKAPGRYRLWW
jgi:hypothetical protein